MKMVCIYPRRDRPECIVVLCEPALHPHFAELPDSKYALVWKRSRDLAHTPTLSIGRICGQKLADEIGAYFCDQWVDGAIIYGIDPFRHAALVAKLKAEQEARA